jgi:hypothetical protein
MELGFGPNDLLLAPTEGGETPFVIGATNKAASCSSRAPYFLYCNPDSTLKNIQRSQEVIENPKIKKVNLAVGPMAISGSTRMQASTVLMLGIGVGLLYEHKDRATFKKFYQDFLNRLTLTDYSTMAEFKDNKITVVVGSSWPKDEEIIAQYINQYSNENVKFIIAPHNIKEEQIANLKTLITKPTVLFSEKENQSLSDQHVFIIDTIGILTKIYSYADIAYVGGGFGNPGIHNILEPATFGIPIVIGPNYSHFAEATALVKLEGCVSIANNKDLLETFDDLIYKPDIRSQKGAICRQFVQQNKGATAIILNHLQ